MGNFRQACTGQGVAFAGRAHPAGEAAVPVPPFSRRSIGIRPTLAGVRRE